MKNLITALMILALSSCSSVHHKRADILERGDNVAVLEGRIQQALLSDVNILAPDNFSKAKGLLEKAMQEAQKSKNPKAGNHYAKDGLAAIDKAEKSSKKTRPILADTLDKRSRAKTVQAHQLFPQEFAKLDRELMLAGKALEEGKSQQGIQKNARLAESFADLEKKALQENVSEKASAAYDEAVKANALRLAPITMEKAKRELEVAKQIIEIEKDNYEKALFHSKSARYFAHQAKNIADLLTAFNKEKLTGERIILWYQDQLSQIHRTHLPEGISFDKANREVVAELEEKITSLSNEVANLGAFTVAAEREIDEKNRVLAQQAIKPVDTFEKISNLFRKKEAEVLKRDDDIIIRSYGFNFPVGKSQLVQSNYTLLKKIVEAIEMVPNSNIEVEGHTDSTGNTALNLHLSQQRSQNITDYLVKVAGIDESRVSAVGLGFEKPLATNSTKEGRTKNRRIEVVIKN